MNGKVIGGAMVLGGGLLAFLTFNVLTLIALVLMGAGAVTYRVSGRERGVLTAKAERMLR